MIALLFSVLISMSIPTTSPFPINSNNEAEKIIEPPLAIPVSIIKSGFVFQMISWSAIISCGY